MFPIGDDNSSRKIIPFVTYGLLMINVVVFYMMMQEGYEFIYRWAFVPARFLANPLDDWPTIFTSMFMHASWAHIFGNMLYLGIFGDNVEDKFGHLRFLVFYFVCGMIATLVQLLFITGSEIPLLGASGAIAGILGSYFLMFPRKPVYVFFIFRIISMPAYVVLGLWIVLQMSSSIGSIANMEEAGGIAYIAHVAGFVAGFFITRIVKKNRPASRYYSW